MLLLLFLNCKRKKTQLSIDFWNAVCQYTHGYIQNKTIYHLSVNIILKKNSHLIFNVISTFYQKEDRNRGRNVQNGEFQIFYINKGMRIRAVGRARRSSLLRVLFATANPHENIQEQNILHQGIDIFQRYLNIFMKFHFCSYIEIRYLNKRKKGYTSLFNNCCP